MAPNAQVRPGREGREELQNCTVLDQMRVRSKNMIPKHFLP